MPIICKWLHACRTPFAFCSKNENWCDLRHVFQVAVKKFIGERLTTCLRCAQYPTCAADSLAIFCRLTLSFSYFEIADCTLSIQLDGRLGPSGCKAGCRLGQLFHQYVQQTRVQRLRSHTSTVKFSVRQTMKTTERPQNARCLKTCSCRKSPKSQGE